MKLSTIIGGANLTGYCPKNSRALEPLKKLLLWAFAKNGGDHCVMSIGVMRRLLRDKFACPVCPRTIEYALKRLKVDGFISRQSQWFRDGLGVLHKRRTKTRPKGLIMREQLSRGLRGLKLLALTWQPGGGEMVQKFASGYSNLLQVVLPKGS